MQNAIAMVAIYSLLALSFMLVLRAGEVSFGQQAFFGVGAYAASLCTAVFDLGIVQSVLLAGGAAWIVAWVVGQIALRLDGFGFSLFTLIFAEWVREAFGQWTWRSERSGQEVGPEGAMGFVNIDYLTRIGLTHVQQVVLVVTTSVAVFALVHLLLSGSFGRKLAATSNDRTLAEARGVPTTSIRLKTFSLAGLVAGVGGALFAHYVTFIDPQNFGLMAGIHALAYTLLGGSGHVLGAILGTAFDVVLLEIFRLVGSYRMVVFGAAIVLTLVVLPNGIVRYRSGRAWRLS